jgi:glycine hydroxymethyltransferase
MDLVEQEGEDLVLSLFGRPKGFRATLQPHSGTQANQIAYNAVLEPGDVVLCLRARDGGHISHTVLIGRRHDTLNYGLTPDGFVDYDSLRRKALDKRPKLIIVGGSALPREIDFRACGEIAKEAGAYLHADISHTATFVAAGLHRSPFPFVDFVTFNTVKNLRGPNAGILMYRQDHAKSVHASIFPTTQGGANESNMLGKFAALLEWQKRNINGFARRIVDTSHILGEALQARHVSLVTGGTDCHILLLDLRERDITGAELELRLEQLGVLANRNLVPGDKSSPQETSGLRLGTTNLAILEYSRTDIELLGTWIAEVVNTGEGDVNVVRSLLGKYRWIPDLAVP